MSSGAALRVVLAEDSALFREGIVRILEAWGCEVVAAVGDRDALLAAASEHRPDVVVTDIRMPPTGTTEGLEAAAAIRRERSETAVLVLSQYVETRHAVQLLEDGAGGVGYLLKDRVADGAEFVDALRRVAAGGSAIDPEVVSRLLTRARQDSELDRLTDREREILAAMAEGRSNRAIGELLFLSPKTVETHVGSIFAKLGLEPTADDHRRVLAVLAYLRAS
ncbi:MAG: response regulator transcription factor [Actinomycetota bacterium]